MKMKNIWLVVALTAVFSTTTILAASIEWDKKVPPPLTIVDGYSKAVAALGETANQYHCVSAKIESASWLYEFASPTQEPKWVDVGFQDGISIRNHPVVLH